MAREEIHVADSANKHVAAFATIATGRAGVFFEFLVPPAHDSTTTVTGLGAEGYLIYECHSRLIVRYIWVLLNLFDEFKSRDFLAINFNRL